ncbi:hypothetical protein QJS10_CPB17g01541 [Acorus calamus]|uniref:Uncharacterized protein n=1 Tax=Acorus calamus TaxID=4465 RepID=A0AAV9CUT4_ACOCL|nr:hypothetical protein QJS10_CPB17g01541 [Acorus calamus]
MYVQLHSSSKSLVLIIGDDRGYEVMDVSCFKTQEQGRTYELAPGLDFVFFLFITR